MWLVDGLVVFVSVVLHGNTESVWRKRLLWTIIQLNGNNKNTWFCDACTRQPVITLRKPSAGPQAHRRSRVAKFNRTSGNTHTYKSTHFEQHVFAVTGRSFSFRSCSSARTWRSVSMNEPPQTSDSWQVVASQWLCRVRSVWMGCSKQTPWAGWCQNHWQHSLSKPTRTETIRSNDRFAPACSQAPVVATTASLDQANVRFPSVCVFCEFKRMLIMARTRLVWTNLNSDVVLCIGKTNGRTPP